MQKLYEKNVIIGGGIAGLVAAFYIKDSIVIDKNPLGQLAAQMSLGPRLINVSSSTEKFCNDFFQENPILFNFVKNNAKIGYEFNRIVRKDFSDEFREKYINITRGKNSKSTSYLSGGKTSIEYFSLKGFDEFSNINTFKFIFEEILYQLIKEKRIIFEYVNGISINFNKVICEKTIVEYDFLISTIRADKFKTLIDKKISDFIFSNNEFVLLPKFFYKCKYNQKQFENSKNFNYIYSIDSEFTRKTYFNGYIVYETTSAVSNNFIDECEIIKRFENVPLQIKENIFFENRIRNVFFSGRFAEWNHSIKLNENISRVLDIKQLING